MGLTEEQIEGVYVAGALLVIGKINTPVRILHKPGLLNDAELEAFQ
jgi:HD-GYP domain-containing protein (c-di-GMP phosphodiesterase class II)